MINEVSTLPSASAGPMFSIITVVLNDAINIENCLNGIRKQTYPNFEYIVIDGGSTDGTLEILERNLDIISQFISEPDLGIYHAMNKGIKLAKGKYIGIINSDDEYKPDTLEKIFAKASQVKDEFIFYGGISKDNNSTDFLIISHEELQHRMIYHPSVFVPLNVYRSIGQFDTKYKIAADYDFMLRCQNAKINFVKIDSVLAIYREGGFSSLHKYRSIVETVQIQLRYSRSRKKNLFIFFKIFFVTFSREMLIIISRFSERLK